jgi:hypothetical protein
MPFYEFCFKIEDIWLWVLLNLKSSKNISKHTHEWWSLWGFPSRAEHSEQEPPTPGDHGQHACGA